MSSADKPWIADLRAKYGDHVADTAAAQIAAMPPLTNDQVAKLRALFATAQLPGRKSA